MEIQYLLWENTALRNQSKYCANGTERAITAGNDKNQFYLI